MVTETDEYRSDLVKQVDDVVDADTGWSSLAETLNVERYARCDKYYNQPTATPKPFRPMFLTILWTHVEDRAPSSAANCMEEQPELAAAFGFDPDNIPDRTTFYRAARDRFEELDTTLTRSARQIRQIAAERGSSIGYPLGRAQASSDEGDDSKPSQRTIQRMLRTNGRRVLQELRSAIYRD